MAGDSYEPRRRPEVGDDNQRDVPQRNVNQTALGVAVVVCMTLIVLAALAAAVYLASH